MPNGNVGAEKQVLGALQERLKEHQTIHPRGQPIPQLTVESCSLAVLALRNHRPPEYTQTLHALLAAQNRDGSWPAFSGDDTQGCWVTALAVLALIAVRQTRAYWAGGIRWLLDAKGREANWFWRRKFRTVDNGVKFDPGKYGWSWVPGTTSWVIPTAFTLVTLQQVRDMAFGEEPGISERIGLGLSMLLDRMCPGGGWNAGNSMAFGVPYAPYRDATSIALLGLSSQAHESGVQASLSWLAARLAGCPSPYSLAWGILALTAYHKRNSEAADALPCATDALNAAIGKGTNGLDTSTLAICLLALEAVQGHNVFEVWR